MARVERNRPPRQENQPARTVDQPRRAATGESEKRLRLDERKENAKKFIEEMTSSHDNGRNRLQQELRRTARETRTVDQIKTEINAANAQNVRYLITDVNQIQYNPEVARIIADIASAPPELRNDPNWLIYKATELAYRQSSNMTQEARREAAQTIFNIRAELQRRGTDISTYDEILYGSPYGDGRAKSVLDDDKNAADEDIYDPELQKMLRDIEMQVRYNPMYLNDTRTFQNDLQNLTRTAVMHGIPEAQMREAIGRVEKVYNKAAEKAQQAHEKAQGIVRLKYQDLLDKHVLRKEDLPKGWENDPGITLEVRQNGFSNEEIQGLLDGGKEGEDRIFDNLVTEIYSLSKDPKHPGLPEEYKYRAFKNYLEWKYRENANAYTERVDYIWNHFSRMDSIIKNLLFTPGDPKDKLRNLQYFQGADHDHLMKNYEYSNLAFSLMEESIFDMMTERVTEYEQSKKFMFEEHDGKLVNFERYDELRKRDLAGTISAKDRQELQRLQGHIDRLGYGVMLWDDDVQNYTELSMQLAELEKLKMELTAKKAGGEIKDGDWQDERLQKIDKEISVKRLSMAGAKQFTEGTPLIKQLSDNRELSPVEVRAKMKLANYLMATDKRFQGPNGEAELKKIEWKLNRAVWASRMSLVGNGRMVDIGAMFASKPAYELQPIADRYGIDIGKYVMRAPAFEDIQRLVNPDLFQYRFGVADEMGIIFRSSLHIDLLDSKGFKFKNDRKYRREYEEHLDPTVRKAREYVRQVQAETGIMQTEILINGFFESGGVFDKTSWRATMGALDPIRNNYMMKIQRGDLPQDAYIDNQGLGIRFATMGTKTEKQRSDRAEMFKKIAKQNPSKLLQLLGAPLLEVMDRQPRKFSDVEMSRVRNALSESTVMIIDHDEISTQRHIDLIGNEAQFNTTLRPFLEKEGFSDERIADVRHFLDDAYAALTEKRADFGGKSRLDMIAGMDIPLTISMSDLDMGETEFVRTGVIAFDRRGRDMMGMAGARDAWLKMQKSAFLIAKDPAETLKNLMEFREAMNNYTTGRAAEMGTYQLARQWLKFNQNRLYYDKWKLPIMAFPGGEQLCKVLAETDFRGPLADILPHHFRHKAAEFVSYGTRFGNKTAFGPREMDKILDEMLEMGIFNANEELYLELRREFPSGAGDQLAQVVFKNWWLLPLAAAAFGLKSGQDEEKGAHH